MSDYANRADRDAITTIAACVGFAEVIRKSNIRNIKTARKHLYNMWYSASKALDAIMDGLDKDQEQGILRFAESHCITLVPRYSPSTEKTHYSITNDELALLISDAVSECQWCEKEGKDARRCQKRKALLRIGAIGQGEKDCPFSGGIEL